MSALDDPNILAKLQPQEFHKKWIETYQTTRPDQRDLNAFRPLTIQTGIISTADSSSIVRLGETTIIGAIKLEVAEPDISSSEDGFVVINVTLCAGCTPLIRAGPPTDRAQGLTQKVSGLFKKVSLISKESLVIVPKKLVWVLHVDLFVINDAGNVFDATWLSLLATLQRLKLPNVRMDDDTGMIFQNPLNPTPLTFSILPLPLSFVYFADHQKLIADPNDSEESVWGSRAMEMLVDGAGTRIYHCESIGIPVDVISQALNSECIKDHLRQMQTTLEKSSLGQGQ